MRTPDWRAQSFVSGTILDPQADDARLVVWLPWGEVGGHRRWLRISTKPHAEADCLAGICGMPAVLNGVRQQTANPVGKWLRRFGSKSHDRDWTMPDGQSVEQDEERRADVVLAWSEEESLPLDETRLRQRWPEFEQVHKIANGLFLILGIKPETEVRSTPAPVSTKYPEQKRRAEQALAAAQAAKDPRAEIIARIDLGAMMAGDGEAKPAIAILEEALRLTQSLGDRPKEADVLMQLGFAVAADGQSNQAREYWEKSWHIARELADPYLEVTALEQLASWHSQQADRERAARLFEQAAEMAGATGDRPRQARWLWAAAIEHAELNARDRALTTATAALELMAQSGDTRLPWYREHMRRYQSGAKRIPGPIPDETAASAEGPGLLRMAMTATKAMAKFLGSGFQVVSDDIYRERVTACANCSYHTGLRCRACGCFTEAKVRLPHEDCPLGKWKGPIVINQRN